MGGNGAGKTSLLEAIHVLGLGRSFRASDGRVLIKSGADTATLSGSVGSTVVGVGLAAGGLEIRIGGQYGSTAAELADLLPVQAIHAEIGGLVQGPPEARRRLLDWGVFHVEHRFLADWRKYRRALVQRNTALRGGAADDLLAAWEAELAGAAIALDQARRSYLEKLKPAFESIGARLLDERASLRYSRGWPADADLGTLLREGRDKDRNGGYTRSGPHRADLQFEIAEEKSRWRASKGQQKLLASAVVLAQLDLVAQHRDRDIALLVDEPAADLDPARLSALMAEIERSRAQLFIAAITAEGLPLGQAPRRFHVEHGQAKALL